MVRRLTNLSKTQSFFLFGARGTGKSTLLKNTPFLKDALYLDLLQPSVEEDYALRPALLTEQAMQLAPGSWVIVDEIQKVPKLLDVVQSLIEGSELKFALTGSSARKLKRGGGNLLAGRAVTFALFPFTCSELGDQFQLDHVLTWGSLPKLFALNDDQERARYLRAYCNTYLKEEVLQEQFVRNLDPFRLFLPIAAQMEGEVLNFSNIARDTGVDHKTISNYFQILEDTYLGFYLYPFSRSIRKVQVASPKFYFFDVGVKRSLGRKLTQKLETSSSEYGRSFESWFINECHRLNLYYEKDFSLSYLRTKDDAEVDLIIEKPSGEMILLEIKSSNRIDDRHVKHLNHFSRDFPQAKLICVSQVQNSQRIGRVDVLSWKQALQEIFR